jgi:hypothetical protein
LLAPIKGSDGVLSKHGSSAEQEKGSRDESVGEKGPGTRRWRSALRERSRRWRSKLWEWTDFGEKKLWDWLQLLSALAIPIVLAIAGFWFTHQQEAHQQELEGRRAEAERNLEEQRAQDTALQAYLDQMSALMLEEDLRNSDRNSEVRTLARARTLTIFGSLDPERKRSAVRFLYESSLIDKADPIVDLSNADLSSADLRLVDLSEADLSKVNLREANLSNARLNGADLNNAVLSDADLPGAFLTGANLINGNLSGANLRSAYLDNADLSLATLNRADLGGAFLRDTDLRGAALIEADLSYADLSGAQGATKETLNTQYVVLEGAIMPDGTKHD